MSKKIGTFLMMMLVMCAGLILMATDSAGSGTEGLAQPGTVNSAAEPTGTLPSMPGPSVPMTEPSAQQTQSARSARSRVEQILDGEPLDETAAAHWVHVEDLNAPAGTTGVDGPGRALAELAAERRMNPISGFWRLVSADVYEKREDPSGPLSVAAFQVPAREAKAYPYSSEGARQLLTDLLTLASGMEDGLPLEAALLGADGAVEQVCFAEAEDCRYAYFTCTSERSTHILCFYLRGEETITDVEFQLLNVCHASGDPLSLAQIESNGDRQAAALMAAAELLMTGRTKAGEGQVPFGYEVGGYKAALERFYVTAETEQGSLTNYRLRSGA